MTTNNHPAHGPVSLDRLHQIREILSKASAQSDGGNLGYAMADAVKVIDGAIAAFDAEPIGTFRKGPCGYHPSFHEDAVPLYAAPQPASVVSGEYGDAYQGAREDLSIWKRRALEAEKEVQRLSDINDYLVKEAQGEARMGEPLIHEAEPVVPDELLSAMEEVLRISDREHEAWHKARNGIASCRAAMLQTGNHTEQHLDMVDCKLPFDQWLSQQNEQIDVDCGCVTTEAFYHWLRVAYEAGNSPVTQDGWQLVPKEPTEAMNKAGWAAINEHDAINPTYRAMLAAAPQQGDL